MSNSHGRIETSHSRMIVIGIVWSSTSIESRWSVKHGRVLVGHVDVGEGDDAVELAHPVDGSIEGDLVVDASADEERARLVDVVAVPRSAARRQRCRRANSILAAIFSWYSRSDGSRSTGNDSRFASTAIPHLSLSRRGCGGGTRST